MTNSVPLFCNQHLTVRNKKVLYLGLIWECGTYALTNLFKILFWVTTITEPDKGQSVKTKPSSWQFGHMVKTHMAQDYPSAQFKTVLIFSLTKTKYMSLILMVNLTPGMYHGNKNVKLWHWWKCYFKLSATFILSGDVTAFMQGYCQHIKCDTVLNIPRVNVFILV